MLIATDLDGTLVPNASTSIRPYTAEVLERVDDAGIPVVFVTGRPLRWMETLWPHIGKHGLAVVSNGAITYNVHEREVVTTTGIEPALGLDLAAAISSAVPGATFAVESLDGIRQDPDFVERDRVPAGSRRGPLTDIWDRVAVKLLVRHETLDHDEFRDRVIAAVGDLANATWSIPGLVEISAAGVTKASALSVSARSSGWRHPTSLRSATCPMTSRCSSGPARRTPLPTRTRASSPSRITSPRRTTKRGSRR